MSKMNAEEAKTIYEISKLTSSTKQIMDDFTHSVVMAMFKDYVQTFKKPGTALMNFMSAWEENIILQKKDELETLSSQQNSMTDMVVGQKLVSEDHVDDFIIEVSIVKELITEAVVNSME